MTLKESSKKLAYMALLGILGGCFFGFLVKIVYLGVGA